MSSHYRILALAGLPGTGKSTLAQALAHELGYPIWNKDRVRADLFQPHEIEFSRAQDDYVMEWIYRAVREHAQDPATNGAILDGRTYLRSEQVQALHALRTVIADSRRAAELVVIECTCAPKVALARLAADLAQAAHPAANRTPELYNQLAARAHPIPEPKLVIATDTATAQDLARRVLASLGP